MSLSTLPKLPIEFWCTAISYDPSPPSNDYVAHPLKEYLIKFSVMNEQKRLTLDNQTFVHLLDSSKVTYIKLTAFMVAVNNHEKSVNLLPFTIKKKKKKPQTVTPTLPQSKGPEASESLPHKRKKPKSKKTPTKTKRNKQLAGTGLPSTQLDEGTSKSQLLPEGNKYNPKDLMGNKQPIDTGLPSTIFDEGTVKTMSLPKGPHGDKDSEGLKPPADMEPLTNLSLTKNESKTSSKVEPDFETLQRKTFADVQSLLLSDDEMVQESDNEEVFTAGEEMDEDIPLTNEEAQSPAPNKEQPEPSHAQESDSDSSSPELKKYNNILPLTERQLVKYLRKVSRVLFNTITEDQWEKHKEATVSCADLKASIEGYYEENVDHRDQTDKLVQATMNSLDKNSTERDDLLKALNGVTEILKAVQEAIK
ncbi:hypothetical protein Tco_0950814 [Tanacetum coccineum]